MHASIILVHAWMCRRPPPPSAVGGKAAAGSEVAWRNSGSITRGPAVASFSPRARSPRTRFGCLFYHHARMMMRHKLSLWPMPELKGHLSIGIGVCISACAWLSTTVCSSRRQQPWPPWLMAGLYMHAVLPARPVSCSCYVLSCLEEIVAVPCAACICTYCVHTYVRHICMRTCTGVCSATKHAHTATARS